MPGDADSGKLLSPLTPSETGTIRCIGLNFKDHAVSAPILEIEECDADSNRPSSNALFQTSLKYFLSQPQR